MGNDNDISCVNGSRLATIWIQISKVNGRENYV